MNLAKFWSPWVGGVSLTFDDGQSMGGQLDKAIPAMNEKGLRGTFYLRPTGEGWDRTREAWRAAAAHGHEIGNHTLAHVCSANFRGGGGLETKTLDDIEADIMAAQGRLVDIAPHQDAWTFCYPCYSSHVGRGAARQSYVPVVARHFLAARGGGEYGVGNHPAGVDLHHVSGLDTSLMSGFEMIGLVEELTSRGRWVVLVFHEIEGRRLSVTGHDFEMLLGYLHRNLGRIWTAPLAEVARRVAAYQSRSAETD